MNGNETEPSLSTMANTFGDLEIAVLPDGWEATGGLVLVRCKFEDRNLWVFRYFGEDTSDEDALGALLVQKELVLQRALGSYEDG